MKVLRITTSANTGAISRTAEQLGELVMAEGWESYIAYSRPGNPSSSQLIKVGNYFSILFHLFLTRCFDMCGYGSYFATKKLIKKIKKISPDIIHIHNIHSYDFNLEVLFNFFSTLQTPIVWTQHDCWAYTGHCTFYSSVNCQKWKSECYNCPQYNTPPKSWWVDGSKRNYKLKKQLFTSVNNMHLVAVSQWMKYELTNSFLSKYPIHLIYNGIDVQKFRPRQQDSHLVRDKYNLGNRKLLIGVASTWESRKGLDDYIELNKRLSMDYSILLVGVTDSIKRKLPQGILAINRTESMDELAMLYSASFISLNLSKEESFGKTTPEAMACGVPCIVYDSTASPELVDEKTGIVVKPNDIDDLYHAILEIEKWDVISTRENCRNRACTYFSKDVNYKKYIELYKKII